MSNKEYDKEYYLRNKERIRERQRKYYLDNKDKIADNAKKWNAENIERRNEIKKKWEDNNPELVRATYLVQNYKRNDKKYNRGECTLSAQWIVDNIFTSKCQYCQKDDWKKLGCDRINNDLPHTPDNVVCCCEECNKKRNKIEYDEFVRQYKQ